MGTRGLRRELRCEFVQTPDQALRIDRSMHLGVVIEVDEDIARGAMARVFRTCSAAIHYFPAPRPVDNSPGPCVNGFGTIAAGVEFLIAVQTAIDEVRGDIHEARPVDGVGDDRSNAVLAQECDEFLGNEAFMTHFNSVPQRLVADNIEIGRAVELRAMMASDFRSLAMSAWEHAEEFVEAFWVELPLRRELPEDGTEFFAEREQTLREEISETALDGFELHHMGEVARTLDGEDEAGRGFGVPAAKTVRMLERVEGAVGLDRIELPGSKVELGALGQIARVKGAAPAFVAPAGDTDTDLTESGHAGDLDAARPFTADGR